MTILCIYRAEPDFPPPAGRSRAAMTVDSVSYWVEHDGPTPTDNDVRLVISPPPTANLIRELALLADIDRQEVYNAIRDASPAQIKSYIQTNVTDLASARAMLIRIALLIALELRR